MKVLIADDDEIYRHLVERTLNEWDYQITAVTNGAQAWHQLRLDDGPRLALLNWMMPELSGAELCRRVRLELAERPTYIIMLTSRDSTGDVALGLQAGADDYVTKPFEREELHARIQVGERVLGLQMQLAERVDELEDALSQVRRLSGLLPICSYCKKVRDDEDRWLDVDDYITKHSDARISHGVCPECSERYLGGVGPPASSS